MKKIVEILKSLYAENKLTREQLQERVAKGTISQIEMNEIIGKID